jgi:hypothetical protein
MPGLDRYRDGVIWGVAVLGEQVQQAPVAGGVVADASFCRLTGVVDEGDVMMIFGPSRARSARSNPAPNSLLVRCPVVSLFGARGDLIPGLISVRHLTSRS